jgi:hypothetical protein
VSLVFYSHRHLQGSQALNDAKGVYLPLVLGGEAKANSVRSSTPGITMDSNPTTSCSILKLHCEVMDILSISYAPPETLALTLRGRSRDEFSKSPRI